MASNRKETRSSIKLRIFEKLPEEMKYVTLPTYEDVIRHYEWLRHDMKQTTKQEPAASEISSKVTQKVIEIWHKASIPTVSNARVSQLIISYCVEYRNLLKNFHRENKGQSYLNKSHNFLMKSKLLFDVAACKCLNYATCKCGKQKSVPSQERPFIKDQHTKRRMIIGNVDKKTTQILRKKIERSQTKLRNAEEEPSTSKILSESSTDTEVKNSSKDEDSDMSTCSAVSSMSSQNTKKLKLNPNRVIHLKKLSETCDRYGVSYRAGAAIASATLQDVNVLSNKKHPYVIDHSKLRRERKRTRDMLLRNHKSTTIEALFFDGRKDKTLYFVRKGKKLYRQIKVEEHLTLVQEPGSVYLGHVTPPTGTSTDVENTMLSFLESHYQVDKIIAVGCDGTNTNTGWKNGIITRMEHRLQRPLQWLICQLHANELPLRRLLSFLDGVTTGPTDFSGPIGKMLKTCENMMITKFDAIEVSLPDLSSIELSTDQKYLFDMCLAVSIGAVSTDLARRKPGKMSHARWLTTANRILRLYVATENPVNNLKILATFVTKVYASTWFQIKCNSYCKDGSRNLWYMINSSRYLSDDLKAIVDPVIERNAYFAHPENIILSMLTDEDRNIRELGCRRVIKGRSVKVSGIRSFRIPKINFDSNSYYSLIDWQSTEVLINPPLLSAIRTEDLRRMVEQKNVHMFDFLKLPCHTQSVERCVKLTTEASSSVAGQKSREGYICARQNSRKVMPKFNSKRDFV